MIAAFSQLNLKIIQVSIIGIARCQTFRKHILVLLVQGLVDRLLNVCHLHINNCLLQRRDRLLNVLLHPSQHVRFQQSVKPFYLLV